MKVNKVNKKHKNIINKYFINKQERQLNKEK